MLPKITIIHFQDIVNLLFLFVLYLLETIIKRIFCFRFYGELKKH